MTNLLGLSLLIDLPRFNYHLLNLRNVNCNAYLFYAYLLFDLNAMCQHFISPKLNDLN
jgi:hypothetical protein